ncbi:MAG: SMC-Scp complex subunit ScpB [Candidatus Woesearchaeota archaeon]|nr:SMC-Scp complex subunit ScpB [Candidatus Woesearchaeota archaeon]
MDTDTAISELKNKVYAVLFSAGRAVDCEELGKLVKAPEELIREAVRELKKQLDDPSSPLFLTEESNGNAWKLAVRDRYVDVVRNVTPHTELEIPVLATLALIAWKQPMLQSDVIKRRSTVAYEHIAKLEELGFVSKEKKGRSFVLKPTGKFFDYFDLPSQEAVKKLFEEIEPRVLKIEQMSNQLRDEAQEIQNEQKKISKKGKLGGLDVYEPPEAPLEKTLEQKEQEGDEAEEETEEEENEQTEEGDDVKEKKVLDELFEDDEKEQVTEEEKETEQEEEQKENEESEEEAQPKKEKETKRKLPRELEDFAGKEDKIGED